MQFHGMISWLRFFITFLFGVSAIFALAACSGGDGAERSAANKSNDELRSEAQAAVADMSITQMADKLIADGQTISAILATVIDSETAKEAEPRVRVMMADYEAMSQRFENLEAPSMTQVAALMSKAPRIAVSQQAVFAELQRIYEHHPEATDVLREALENFGDTAPPTP